MLQNVQTLFSRGVFGRVYRCVSIGLLYFAKSDILRNLNEIDILRNYDEGKLYFAKLEF